MHGICNCIPIYLYIHQNSVPFKLCSSFCFSISSFKFNFRSIQHTVRPKEAIPLKSTHLPSSTGVANNTINERNRLALRKKSNHLRTSICINDARTQIVYTFKQTIRIAHLIEFKLKAFHRLQMFLCSVISSAHIGIVHILTSKFKVQMHSKYQIHSRFCSEAYCDYHLHSKHQHVRFRTALPIVCVRE